MASTEVKIVSNVKEFLEALDETKKHILDTIGTEAVKYASELTPTDTGRLKENMEYHLADNNSAVIFGTNVEYGIYIELGTGIYASEGLGRQTPWFYEDKDGERHITRGSKPHHMIKIAASQHGEEYKQIITSFLKGK